MQLSRKQNEYIVNATHRWNIKSGAVRSGKSYVDTAFVVPFRIRERKGKPGLNVILGVSKESIERNVLEECGSVSVIAEKKNPYLDIVLRMDLRSHAVALEMKKEKHQV